MYKDNKELLLIQAQGLLNSLRIEDLETVQINSTKYDDGSEGLSIDITYPSVRQATAAEKEDSFTIEKIPSEKNRSMNGNKIYKGELITQWNFDSKTSGVRFNGEQLEFMNESGEVFLTSNLDGQIISN